MSYDYDIAQICENGHIINDAFRTYQLKNKNYCPLCGARTVIACPRCKATIQGALDPEGEWETVPLQTPPRYCQECGNPFPWTEKEVTAAREFIEEFDNFDIKERQVLLEDLDDLIRDTPKTKPAAIRAKKILAGLSKEAYSVAKGVLINILASGAKSELGMK